MSTAELRRDLKKVIDALPPDRLASVSDFVHFLNRPSLLDRVATARKAASRGKSVNWRKVRRSDV
jgi:hypothetical protein